MPTRPPDPSQRIGAELGGALFDAGMPQMPARVFAALLADDDGQMTAVDLQRDLGVSAGAVSGAVNYLEQFGLLTRERVPGSRADAYVVQEDAWHDAILHSDAAYAPLIVVLGRALEQLDRESPARLRLEITQEFLVFLGGELRALVGRWDAHKARFLRERGAD